MERRRMVVCFLFDVTCESHVQWLNSFSCKPFYLDPAVVYAHSALGTAELPDIEISDRA